MEDLIERLAASGYERLSQVTTRGQFAVRGGIVDLYSWQAPLPFRLEFFGDEIESLREFDIDTQASVRDLRSIDVLLAQGAADQGGSVRDYVRDRDVTINIEPAEDTAVTGVAGVSSALERASPASQIVFGGTPKTAGARAAQGISRASIEISENWIETGPEDFSGAFQECEIGEFGAGDLVLAEAKRAQFVERLKEWRANNARILIYFQTEGEIERFREIMGGAVEGLDFVEGTLARGFCFPAAKLVVLSAAELFGRFAVHPRRLLRLRRAERHRVQIDFSDLTEGERWDGFWSSLSDGYYVRCTRTGGAIEWFKLADDEPVAAPRSETRVLALHPKSRGVSRVNVVIAQSPSGRRMLVGSARRTSR